MRRDGSPAVNGDWSVLAELLLGLVHLADEIDEFFAGLGHSLFRPVGKLELTHGPRLTVLCQTHPHCCVTATESCKKHLSISEYEIVCKAK